MYIDACWRWQSLNAKKTKLIRKIIAGTIVFLTFAPQGRQNAQEAPLSMFLLRRPCVSTGIGNWAGRTENVSVGKAVYTSRLFMGPGNRFAAMTCRLQPNEAGVSFQRLRLSFGMRDNDRGSPNVDVTVYKDGVRETSVSVFPGEQGSVSLDVTPTQNISIEAICSNPSQYCDRVYFWDASLSYIPPSPQ